MDIENFIKKGKTKTIKKHLIFNYKIDTKEQGHYQTIKTYPNGGEDVEWVIDIPEQGKWIATYNGVETKTKVVVPSYVSKEQTYEVDEENETVVPYTEAEILEIRKNYAERQEQEKIRQEKQKKMNEIPNRLDNVEASIDDLILLTADLIGGAI